MLTRLLKVVVILAVLLTTAASSRAVASEAVPGCVAGDTLCLDDRAPDPSWRAAAGLTAVPNRWDGSGVTVASIDTGVVPNADLGDRLVRRVDFTHDHDGIDRFGHGTHLAGLIAGDGTVAGDAYQGAAPKAKLVSAKVAGWDGATDVSTVIAALRWAVSQRDRLGIRVVSLAWGTDSVQPTDIDPLNAAVERASAAGLVVVVSAGNSGPLPGPIAKPGDDPRVITVGAADTAGTADRSDDTVAEFSSRPPTGSSSAKPDLVAPGVSLVSDRAPGSTADVLRPQARVGANMFKGSGTSQASAVVAGIVARMLQASPTLRPSQVKGILLATARRAPAGPGAGAGMVDAGAAVEMAARGPEVAPVATTTAPRSSGAGTIAASRGSQRAWVDFAGRGVPEPLDGERNALGLAWRPETLTAEWSPDSWARTAWAPLISEVPGDAAPTRSAGPAPPQLGAAPEPWGLQAPPAGLDADWAAKYWGAKYWGAKYWGTSLWQ